jgi:CHAD domain-containing protein
MAEAHAALGAIDRHNATGVHDYRKAMKRWRAFLRLVEPLVGTEARALRTEARDLARRLAGARDLQGMLDALEDLDEAELGLSKTSVASMRGRVETAKQAAEGAALTADLSAVLQRARMRAVMAIERWPFADIMFEDLAGAFARHYGRARRAIPKIWSDADAEALHHLRQWVVVHRYQMELLEPLWPRFGKLWVAEAQRLRERLGAHQDLVLLENTTAPHQMLAPWRARLAPLIEQRKATHGEAARRLAMRLFAERPKAFRRRIAALWDVRF